MWGDITLDYTPNLIICIFLFIVYNDRRLEYSFLNPYMHLRLHEELKNFKKVP